MCHKTMKVVSLYSLPHYYVELEVTGKCVNSGGGYGLEILAWFRFYEPEKPTQWLETRLTKIEKQLRESATYKIYFFCARMILWYPILGLSAIESSLLREDANRDLRKLSRIICPLHRSFSMRVWPSFHPFSRKMSIIWRCPLWGDFTVVNNSLFSYNT